MANNPDLLPALTCRSCRQRGSPTDVVLDLGDQPSPQHYPPHGAPWPDPTYPVAMWCCPGCGLAQLVHDSSDLAETPAVEPEAVRRQAREAVEDAVADGLITGNGTVAEIPSPHGGSWLPLLADHGLEVVGDEHEPVDVLVDSFGAMHEPDQLRAFARRAERLKRSGVLLLNVHLLGTIVRERQWTSLRLGHYAYYSLTALTRVLAAHELEATHVRRYDLYSGCAVIAVRHRGAAHPDDTVATLLDEEAAAGLTAASRLRVLQEDVVGSAKQLREHLEGRAAAGIDVVAYGAASRATALLHLAGATPRLLRAIGDASPHKHGRRLPGTGIPVVSPDDLVESAPHEVLLMLPDLEAEVARAHPSLAGRLLPVLTDGGPLERPTPTVTRLGRSSGAQARLHELVPGGAHTYARGPDQYPRDLAPVLVRGHGGLSWDADNNCYVEYGSGLRAVTLGHAHPVVDAAVARAVRDGVSFSRVTLREQAVAERFLGHLAGGDRVKFAKNGSDVTTAAIRLARAATGRDKVAVCDQSFFSVDDWYIAGTDMNRGIPSWAGPLGLPFPFDDLPALQALLDTHGRDVAAVIMQPATATVEPSPGYLASVRRLCDRHGVVLVFDEIITGHRWAVGGVQALTGVVADLSCWAKGIGNGYAVAALTGRAELMDLGGLATSQARTFLLSTTYGPETVGLAALDAVLDVVASEDPLERMAAAGRRLRAGVGEVVAAAGLEGLVGVVGHPACLMYETRDATGTPSQQMRTVLLEGLIRHGVLGQSFVTCAAHTDQQIDHTIAAVGASLADYRRALDDGADSVLAGPPVAPALRSHAAPREVRLQP